MVILKDEKLQKKLNELLEKVEKNPRDPIYSSPVILDRDFPIRIFIWNPIERFGLKLNCLSHNKALQHASWSSNVLHNKNRLNPRLIFCLHYNILLVQKVYKCPMNDRPCLLLATNSDLMDRYSEDIIKCFPFHVFPTTILTQRMIEFTFEMASSGSDFRSIARSAANLKASEYSRTFTNIQDEHLEGILLNSPAPSRLETLFMEVFKRQMSSYQQAVSNAIPTSCITFNLVPLTHKSVLKHSKDRKKVLKIKMNLFLAVDECDRVIAWRLVEESGGLDQLDETLQRLGSKATRIQYVVTDSCCASDDIYKTTFHNVPFKCNLKKVVEDFTNIFSSDDYRGKDFDLKRFIAEFNHIFHDPPDDGLEQGKTVDEDILILRFENFIQKNQDFIMKLSDSLVQKLDDYIKELKMHIFNGCLSGIKIGSVNDKKNNIHHLLNHHYLKGTWSFYLLHKLHILMSLAYFEM